MTEPSQPAPGQQQWPPPPQPPTGRLKGRAGGIEFDGRTVTVRRRYRGVVRVPASGVQAVEFGRAGLLWRYMRLVVPGATATARPRRAVVGSRRRARLDPYAVVFRAGRRGEFEALAAAVEAARDAGGPVRHVGG